MRKNIPILAGATLLAIILSLNSSHALAQSFGWLRGRVSDEIRNPISNAKILIKSSNAEYEVEADAKGKYKIRVPIGEYQISIKERPGFAEYKRDQVQVKSGETTVLNITPESRLYYEDCDKGLLKP